MVTTFVPVSPGCPGWCRSSRGAVGAVVRQAATSPAARRDHRHLGVHDGPVRPHPWCCRPRADNARTDRPHGRPERIGTVDAGRRRGPSHAGPARRYLCTSSATPPGRLADTALRTVVPENPRRAYDVRKVIEGLADVGTLIDGPAGAAACRRRLVRLGGRAVGVMANNPTFGAGALDRDGSDKISRHIELGNAFDLPLLPVRHARRGCGGGRPSCRPRSARGTSTAPR